MDSTIDIAIREIVRQEIAGLCQSPGDPELISVDKAAELCDNVDKSVILALHHDRHANGFPSVKLGPKTIKIDKRRLAAWFASGGLGVKA